METLLKNFWTLLILFFVISGILILIETPQNKPANVSLSELVEQINQGKVKTVSIKGNELSITLKDEKKEKASKESESSLTETLANYGVDKDRLKEVSLAVEEPSGASYWATLLLPFLLPFLLIAGFIWFMMRQAQRGNSQALSFGMSKARILDPADKRKRITFKDIAGAIEAKQELEEIVICF